MNKSEYIAEVTRQLEAIYRLCKSGITTDTKAKHHCEGFMQAGEFLGLVTREELSILIESTHLAVFGETVAQRKARKDTQLQWPSETIDYSRYDSPTYDRKGWQR